MVASHSFATGECRLVYSLRSRGPYRLLTFHRSFSCRVLPGETPTPREVNLASPCDRSLDLAVLNRQSSGASAQRAVGLDLFRHHHLELLRRRNRGTSVSPVAPTARSLFLLLAS